MGKSTKEYRPEKKTLLGHNFNSIANREQFENMVSEAREIDLMISEETDTSKRNQMSVRKRNRVRGVVEMVLKDCLFKCNGKYTINLGVEMRGYLMDFCEEMGYSFIAIKWCFLHELNAGVDW